jgi:hypothetical protein
MSDWFSFPMILTRGDPKVNRIPHGLRLKRTKGRIFMTNVPYECVRLAPWRMGVFYTLKCGSRFAHYFIAQRVKTCAMVQYSCILLIINYFTGALTA